MAEEPEKQPEKTEKAGKTPNQQFVEDFVSEFPYAKPILKYIRREGRAIYDGFIVFGIIALIIGWFAFSKGYDYGAKALETTKGELKDAKGDRDKYQLMLAPFQAMAIQVYTNVPLDKRLDYFTSQFLTFKTNLLTDIEAEKPFFDFFINNRLVTNGSVISVKESRQLEINIRNSSEISAENLNSLALILPVKIFGKEFCWCHSNLEVCY